jgi:hypothetical protein
MAMVLTHLGAAAVAAQAPNASTAAARNPEHLTAVLQLERLGSKEPPRVRFEWRPVADAPAYLLKGTITDPKTWQVAAAQFRVTPSNATEWTPTRVSYVAPVNPGLHSWKLIALRGADNAGDDKNAAVATFEVRQGDR